MSQLFGHSSYISFDDDVYNEFELVEVITLEDIINEFNSNPIWS